MEMAAKNRGAPGLRLILRALEHRNFRLFFGGQSISLIGTWMQRIALGWLVYHMSNSPFLLGTVGFALKLPALRVAARPIYVKMGLIPEVVSGIQSATELTMPGKKSF